MGWYVRTNGLSRGETADGYLRSEAEYTADKPEGRYSCTVLASAMVGSTWYAAARYIRPAMADKPATDIVTALVYLTSRRGGFGYKPMDESAGPCECNCPARIMALLSPAEQVGHYAPDWRKRCAEQAASKSTSRKLKPQPGDRVEYAEPLSYGGVLISAFIVAEPQYKRRGLIGRPVSGGGLYRMPSDERLTTATITRAST